MQISSRKERDQPRLIVAASDMEVQSSGWARDLPDKEGRNRMQLPTGWGAKISSPGLNEHAWGNRYVDSSQQNDGPTCISRGSILS